MDVYDVNTRKQINKSRYKRSMQSKVNNAQAYHSSGEVFKQNKKWPRSMACCTGFLVIAMRRNLREAHSRRQDQSVEERVHCVGQFLWMLQHTVISSMNQRHSNSVVVANPSIQ
jgi:hypothetical protein